MEIILAKVVEWVFVTIYCSGFFVVFGRVKTNDLVCPSFTTGFNRQNGLVRTSEWEDRVDCQ